MYRRQVERGRRSRRGMMPLLERRTVWRDRSLSPTIERNQLGAEPALARYQNHSNRLGSFTQGLKLSENNSRSRHRYRERLDNSTELRRSASRMSPTSARIGSMECREYLGRELAKHYRERDRLTALERTRNGGIRVQDELNRSVNRVQPSEYDTEQMQSCHLQTESQLVTEEIGGKINISDLNSWRIEDLLGGQSVLNADSIQNAQTWIANDTSLSPAQVVRARELLQELLITITTKPDMPIAEDRLTNFVADRRISDYNSDYSSRSFSHHSSTQSALRRDAVIRGREFPVMQNSLPGVPLAIPAHNWRDDPLPVYPDSREMPMSSRDIAKNPDFRCGSRSDYPILYPENAEFEKGNDTEHDPNLLPSEKRRLHYHDRRRISRSRSRSLGKDCDAAITERRVHIKSRDYVGVGTNHPQKGSGRNHICDEKFQTSRRHHGESRNEKSVRRSSPNIRTMRRHRR